MLKPFKLPDGFLMGSATAAAQIEGGDRNNNWFSWCESGKIKDGTSCLRANDHWNRYREDTELLKDLGHRVYRMGLEWSRIEPENGRFDDSAMSRYRDELMLFIRSGIRPLVTLHHFSHPLWFCEEGEFESEKAVVYFERYVRYVIEKIGDIVSEYITINEPNVYVANGYFTGEWPPGKKDIGLAIKVYRNMALCHIAAYKAIHEIRARMGWDKAACMVSGTNAFAADTVSETDAFVTDTVIGTDAHAANKASRTDAHTARACTASRTMVGVANHLRIFDPYSRNPLDFIAAKVMCWLFQGAIIKSMTTGRLRFPIGFGAPMGSGRYYDFIGINYYSRSAVRFKGFKNDVMPGTPRNDLDWEIYPEGLYTLCKEFYKKYRAPIWITENGTCDSKDNFRAKYIYDHLYEISRLCEEGIPVERYYHWTLMDNFEWVEGESARFGLVHVDFETQQRTVRKSGRFFSEICRSNSVTDEMISKYL